MIHLDTSFLIRGLVSESAEDTLLRKWLLGEEGIAISAICWAEFLCGPLEPQQVAAAADIVGEQVPFTQEHAIEAARLFNLGGRRRGSFADCMIAATALCKAAALATANPDDFRRFEKWGLNIITA